MAPARKPTRSSAAAKKPKRATGVRRVKPDAEKASPPEAEPKSKPPPKISKARGKAVPSVPEVIGTAELAKFLGISAQRLTQLVDDGTIPKRGRGEFVFAEANAAYWNFRLDGEKKKAASTSADKLRDQRQAEIARRMLAVQDELSGAFLDVLGGLPARITRDQKERRRIEAVCDEERDRLAKSFAEKAHALRTGDFDSEAFEEADA